MPLDQSPKTAECGRGGSCDSLCGEERLGACREGWTWCSSRGGRAGADVPASGRGVLGRRRALAVVPRSFPLAGCVPGGALRAPILLLVRRGRWSKETRSRARPGTADASPTRAWRVAVAALRAGRTPCALGPGPAPPDIAVAVGRSGQDFPAHASRRHDGDIGGPAPTREPAA